MTQPYQRVLLKLSGESLMGINAFGIDPVIAQAMAHQIRTVHSQNIEVGIVIGGGNIWRGLSDSARGMDRSTADYMGMLATVLNALTLQDALEQEGVHTRVMSAIAMNQVAEPYIRRRAIRHMEKGRVVILAAGTGNPYFTTDTAAALRAIELDADVLLMAKNRVDGVYSADPHTEAAAIKYDHITYQEAIEKDLRVMDTAALTLCRDNCLPILVFDVGIDGAILRAAGGEHAGTLVSSQRPVD